jgi:hypothetical protein
MQEGSEQDNQQQAGWVFKPGDTSVPAINSTENGATSVPAPHSSESILSWSASEFVANPKNAGWFMTLALATVLLAVIVYFLTNDWISVVVIAVLGIIVGIFAAQQPKTLKYTLDRTGIHLGPRSYPYHSFKSFSVVHEGAFNHISLLPLKRFMPPLTVHYPPEEEESVINTFADYLPYEEHKPDLIDSFSRRVRF